MYNHYQKAFDYVTIDAEPITPHPNHKEYESRKTPLLPGGGLSGIQQFLSGITSNLKLDHFDTGDILLILIILFLLLEGDNLELIITLGLMLLLGLGDSGVD